MLRFLRHASRGKPSKDTRSQPSTPLPKQDQPEAGRETLRAADAIAQGKRLFAEGRLAETLALTDRALASYPADPALHFARGATLFTWGRFREALESYERAGSTGLDDLELDLSLGWTAINLHRPEEAANHFRRAVARDPDSEQAQVALANALEIGGALVLEAAEFERRLSRWTQNYEGLILLASCRLYLGDDAGAVTAIRKAISLDPSRSRAWANLGVVLSREARFDEAFNALRRAHAIDTANGSAESVVNYATVLREDGHIEEALRVIEGSLAAHPDPRTHWLRSMFLLELGRYGEAWSQHEFRWMKEPLVDHRRGFAGPVWGGQDLAGKTVMLQLEQGLGDAFEFVRFARPLKERGARVVLDSFRDLGDIAHDFHDIDEVAADSAPPPCDFRIPALSAARVLGTTLDTIPTHIPYVDVRPQYRARWDTRITSDGGLTVGLAWSGNPKHPRDRYRSMRLACLAPLWQVEGVRWYSLQKSATAEAEIADCGLEIVDLGKDFTSFRDTAAAISLLDLVITVDTSVAHLAGALGRPTWVMVGEPPDWRWLAEGDTTPWYPSARIFRQTTHNQWGPVIDAVQVALRERVASYGKDTAQSPPAMHPPIGTRQHATPAPQTEHPPEYCGVDETRNGIVQSLPSTEVAASLAYYGEHRQAELDLVGRFLKPGARVIEAGCGVGVATLFFARAVGEAGHVIAYESDRLRGQIVQNNLMANRVRNVTLLVRGLAGELLEAPGTDGNRHDGTPTDTIDGLRVGRLDWIRINSKAVAANVLAGASATLWRLRPWIFVSTEGGAGEEAALVVLRDHAYQCRRFRAPLFNPANYNRRSDDIFGGRLAYGLLGIPEEVEIDTELEGCTPVS